ncbi:MAG: hypothetical protein VXZ82_17135 [Planctomycetota bacterium]|nr:hypothetical protein [Planctomycetota bacterium]
MSLKNPDLLGGTNKLLLICVCLALPISLQAQEATPTPKTTASETVQKPESESISWAKSDFRSEVERLVSSDDATQAANAESELTTEEKQKAKLEAKAAAKVTEDGKTRFLHLRTKKGEPKSLDTAVVTYRAATENGVKVDLIGAVHIGEASYYEKLNSLFDEYDVLLYELVAPEGTEIPMGGKREEQGFNPVGALQGGMQKMLGLELQLEKVDYTKEHFVRADMTPSQMGKKMAERGETPFTLALDTFSDLMKQQNKIMEEPKAAEELLGFDPEDISIRDVFSNPLKMKRMMANQFAKTGSLDQGLGRSLNQLLIVDRNAVALQGLQKQIAAGKKTIGIFYGAAHLPDFEKHLLDDFGLKKTNHRWLAAWDLNTATKPKLDKTTELLLNVLKFLED